LKKLFLYRPFLWLRRILLFVLAAAIIFGLVLYIVVNSPVVIKRAAKIFASDYNLSYSSIEGNILTGVKIDDLAYENEKLAKHILFRWNTNGLFQRKIVLNTLKIEEANVDAILRFVASFEGNESKMTVSHEENASEVTALRLLMPKIVVIEDLQMDLLPASYDPLSINRFVLVAKDVIFDAQNLVVQDAEVELEGSTDYGDAVYSGRVKDNHLVGNMRLIPNEKLFELYALPVRKEAIGGIVIDFDASAERVVADVSAKATQLLKSKNGEFNIDIKSLLSHVVYGIKDGVLVVDSEVIVDTPYAKDIFVSNRFVKDGNISYTGKAKAKTFVGIDAKLAKPLQNLQLNYKGDAQSIQTDFLSDSLKGYFNSLDFKKGDFHLETTKAMLLSGFISLPEELEKTKFNAVVDAPIEFDSNLSIKAKTQITSNLANIKADIVYGKTLQVDAVAHLPQDSLLRTYNKEVKWDNLNPIAVEIKMVNDAMKMTVNTGVLSANANYSLKSKQIEGKITFDGLNADIEGIADKKITINTKVKSVASMIKSLQSIYTLDTFSIEGSANMSVVITGLKKIDVLFQSPTLKYQADRRTTHAIDDIEVKMSMEDSNLVLSHYKLTYNKMKLFSTKPSLVNLEKDTIYVKSFWLNDALKVEGEYNQKTKKGTLSAQADKLHIEHKIADLDGEVDVKILLDGEKTSINGTILLVGGDIHYDINAKGFATDSDIIILQEMKDKSESPFMDNLSMSVRVYTEEPLIYKQGDLDVKANVDLNVYKAENAEVMLLGSVNLLEGGSYYFEGKRFILNASYIYFTGDPNKPRLEQSIKYQTLNYLITVRITGTPEAPNISFSSTPSLTKEQILSLILFDSEAVSGSHSGEDMMKMMGGSMAKSVLSNMGVKIDYLVFGSDSSVEIGKKLTDKLTVVYVNGLVSSVKLKYRHGKRLESVIEASEESTSYDIIYKRDFKDLKEFKEFKEI